MILLTPARRAASYANRAARRPGSINFAAAAFRHAGRDGVSVNPLPRAR